MAMATPVRPASQVSTRQLSNGLRLVVESASNNAIVAVVCVFEAAAGDETDAECGLTNLTLRMLTRGTRSKTASQLAERIESRGASLSAGATEDHSYVSLVCLREDLSAMLSLLREVVFEPRFDPAEIDKERETILAALKRREDNPLAFVSREFLADLYKGHPYERDPQGTSQTLPAFVPPHLEARHAEVCRADQALVSVVGDVDPESMARSFGRWPKPPAPAAGRFRVNKSFSGAAMTSRVIHRDVTQAVLATGFVTASLSDKDYPAVRVASAILGEGMSSRLFLTLRERGGLAYSVGSASVPRFDKSYLLCHIGCAPQNTDAALTGIHRQVQRLREEMVDEEELERARNYVVGKWRLSMQTNEARARFRALCVLAGLGSDYEDRYPDIVQAVTANDVRYVALKYFSRPVTVVIEPHSPKAQP